MIGFEGLEVSACVGERIEMKSNCGFGSEPRDLKHIRAIEKADRKL
jgi:hypothetical protein